MTELLSALHERVLIADGGMGSLLLAHQLTDADFKGVNGCFEVLNVTRPDIIESIHAAYFEAGADCVETNTFGANYGSLGEYGIVERLYELAQAGAVIARRAADAAATPGQPRFVLGSMGPGTKLPSLRHAPYAILRDAYQTQAEALISGGVDAFQIETCQDLLQAKAAVIGAKRAQSKLGTDLPIFVNVTFETNGTMLLGSEVGSALTSLAALGISGIGMNCGTGPEMMSEHLRYLSENSALPIICMPNAGLPQLSAQGAVYPLSSDSFARYVAGYADDFGLNLVGGCCGTTPEHIAALRAAVGVAAPKSRNNESAPAISSIFSSVELKQEVSYLSIGERTNANGSKAFREAMLAADWDECLDIAKAQSVGGAHLIDVCVDYVGRDGSADMSELAARLAVNAPLPIMLDSTDPAVIEAGLECLGGRSVINSVSFEDGAGPDSRFSKIMAIAREHGSAILALTIDENGQARTSEAKVALAERLIASITRDWGFAESDIVVDCLTFPIGTGQEETRKDAAQTLAAIAEITRRHPDVSTTLGISNVSFGLNPAARVVLNSVFLSEAVKAGLSSAIVHAARIEPVDRIPAEQFETALDLIYDRRRADYDPLAKFLDLFADVTLADTRVAQDEELAALPVAKRLRQRIVTGSPKGLSEDLAQALGEKSALAIIN
ncbi:MAG: homocysteine S-methyltransferase family protein, partial [Propionibacteriaceae bacterium]|nr:homocysteine S-methyltransferase family protein [Propionibacteriaceae bacterium]